MIDYLVKCPSDPYENTNCFGDLDIALGSLSVTLKSTGYRSWLLQCPRTLPTRPVTTVSTDEDSKIILPLILLLIPVGRKGHPLLSPGQQSSVDQMCSDLIGVTYGSDDMTDKQCISSCLVVRPVSVGLTFSRPVHVLPGNLY